MKKCPKCKQKKDLSLFHIARDRSEGRSGWCAECKNEKMRNSRTRESERESYRRDRKKKIMRSMTGRLIRAGKIKKKPCSVCSNENAESHHISYLNPYDIDWLCSVHHAEKHTDDKSRMSGCSTSNMQKNRETGRYPSGYNVYKKKRRLS